MKTNTIFFRLFVMLVIGMTACSKSPDINNATMLDGDIIFDPSLYDPAQYLVSVAIDSPTAEQLQMPVVIAAHGYSSTTYEWDEFRTYCDAKGGMLVSQVLLGGHGRTYEAFKNSSWKDWQDPIMAEYNALRAKGYQNINFAGSSTACPLMLHLIKNGEITAHGLRQIFMVDPIVIPSDKLLSVIGLVGPMLGYMETTMTTEEEGHWYHFRPQETLQELLTLTELVRKDLQSGFKLPPGCQMKVYKSIKDESADPVSAVLIFKGLKNNDGSDISVEMLDSELHVVTRLQGRDGVTQHDRDIQAHVFDDIYEILSQL